LKLIKHVMSNRSLLFLFGLLFIIIMILVFAKKTGNFQKTEFDRLEPEFTEQETGETFIIDTLSKTQKQP